jgi:hypothetical protein
VTLVPRRMTKLLISSAAELGVLGQYLKLYKGWR